jgi:hypothetical protein
MCVCVSVSICVLVCDSELCLRIIKLCYQGKVLRQALGDHLEGRYGGNGKSRAGVGWGVTACCNKALRVCVRVVVVWVF